MIDLTKNHLLKITDKNIVKEIKDILNSQSFVKCGICDAVKVDSMDLARALHFLTEKFFEEDEEKSEIFSKMLWEIIEYEPEFEDDIDYSKRFKDNEGRYCSFLDPNDYASRMYIKYPEVVFPADNNCECLKAWLDLFPTQNTSVITY
jgi:hypothetical protein